MSGDIVVQNESAVAVISIIQRAATDPNCDIDKMERLLAMHERMVASQASQAFAQALAEMQCEIPVIPERGSIKGRNDTIQSTYALWEDVNELIKPVLSRHGFAISFRTSAAQDGVLVSAVLSHKAGHSERTEMFMPPDASGSKNGVQAIGSSISYGKRYTASALLNITSCGEDDDGVSASRKHEPKITAVQLAMIESVLKECSQEYQSDVKERLGDLSQMPPDKFDKMLASFKNRRDKEKAAQADQQP